MKIDDYKTEILIAVPVICGVLAWGAVLVSLNMDKNKIDISKYQLDQSHSLVGKEYYSYKEPIRKDVYDAIMTEFKKKPFKEQAIELAKNYQNFLVLSEKQIKMKEQSKEYQNKYLYATFRYENCILDMSNNYKNIVFIKNITFNTVERRASYRDFKKENKLQKIDFNRYPCY